MTCIVDERDDAKAARRALLAHEPIAGASLLSPREDPYNAWTIEGVVVTDGAGVDGWAPPLARTAAEHGLTLREYKDRTPDAARAVLTL